VVTCTQCGRNLPATAFKPSRIRSPGRGCCRECYKRRGWNRDRRRRRKRNPEHDRRRYEAIGVEKLRRETCVDCGLVVTPQNLAAFDFDHRDRSIKRDQVGRLVGSPAALAAEMAKCDLRCAHCHRLKTWRNKDWVSPAQVLLPPTLFGEHR